VIIIGAGLCGLQAARTLLRKNKKVLVLEKSDRRGGLVGSESFEDCILDFGFQVILPAYPCYKEIFLLSPLELKSFRRGALLVSNKERKVICDPIHEPSLFFNTITISPLEIIKIIKTFLLVPLNLNKSTGEFLENLSTESVTRKFLESFLRGVLLDYRLSSPLSLTLFYLKMFFLGGAALPRFGMQNFADLLGKDIPIIFGEEVTAVYDGEVTCQSGTRYSASTVIYTIPETIESKWQATTTFYFLVSEKIILNKLLLLIAQAKEGQPNHIANLSEVSEDYSPKGTSLISVSTVGQATIQEKELRIQLAELFDIAQFDIAHFNIAPFNIASKITPSKITFLKKFDIQKAVPQFKTIDVASTIKSTNNIFYASTAASYGSQNTALNLGAKVALLIP